MAAGRGLRVFAWIITLYVTLFCLERRSLSGRSILEPEGKLRERESQQDQGLQGTQGGGPGGRHRDRSPTPRRRGRRRDSRPRRYERRQRRRRSPEDRGRKGGEEREADKKMYEPYKKLAKKLQQEKDDLEYKVALLEQQVRADNDALRYELTRLERRKHEIIAETQEMERQIEDAHARMRRCRGLDIKSIRSPDEVDEIFGKVTTTFNTVWERILEVLDAERLSHSNTRHTPLHSSPHTRNNSEDECSEDVWKLPAPPPRPAHIPEDEETEVAEESESSTPPPPPPRTLPVPYDSDVDHTEKKPQPQTALNEDAERRL
eukprot:655996-Amorphochlora_amoeboformis.AAC.1